MDYPSELERFANEFSPDKGDLEAALKESGAVILEAGESAALPKIDMFRFGLLSEPSKVTLQEIANRSVTYLQRPIIADDFEDQHVRREWRTSIKENYIPEVSEFFESNRIRLNNIHPFLYKIPHFRVALAKEPQTDEVIHLESILDDLLALTGVVQSLESRYAPMTLEEKIRFVQQLSAITRTYLSYVTGAERLEEAA